MKLEGRVAIVTGATSGMGREIALLFAREGARVVLSGRDASRAEAVQELIRQQGGESTFIAGDVSRIDTNEELVTTAVGRFGGLDILVPNAGMLGLGSVTEVDLETWRSTIETNLFSVFYLMRLGIPVMQKQGRGTIVINGSIAAQKGFPNHAAYCASKGALPSLVRQTAIDYAPEVRINLLATGPVDTPLIWNSAAAFPDPEAAVREAGLKTLMKRLGTPVDIAQAALFLASDDSDWITGTALTIDGGIMTG